MELIERAHTDLLRANKIGRRLGVSLGAITAAVLLGESLLYLGATQASLFVYLLTFAAALLVPLSEAVETDLFRAFVLLPLFRLVNLGMPVFFETTLPWLVLVYGSLLVATAITAVTLTSANVPTVTHLRRLVWHAPVIGFVAVVVGVVEYVILTPEPLIASLAPLDVLLLIVVMVGFVGLCEEFLFRGVLQSTIDVHAGPGPAIGLSAVLFGLLHSGTGTPEAIGLGVFGGIVFGVYYQLTSNWLVTAVAHGLTNVLVYGLFPLTGLLSPLLG